MRELWGCSRVQTHFCCGRPHVGRPWIPASGAWTRGHWPLLIAPCDFIPHIGYRYLVLEAKYTGRHAPGLGRKRAESFLPGCLQTMASVVLLEVSPGGGGTNLMICLKASLFQFLLRALHRALMVPWMCLGEKREPTVARPHSLPLFPQRHPEQRNGASLRCQNKLALFPAVQEASSDLVFAKP